MNEAVMDALQIYVFGAILATGQVALSVVILLLRRNLTKAEAIRQTAEATQLTANSFNTLTETITKMATDFSGTLMQTIALVNSREKRIDELESENRLLRSDADDLRKQFGEITVAAAERDTEIGLLKDSIAVLKNANSNQAQDIIELKARVLGLQDDNKKKDELLKERDKLIAEKDARINELEANAGEREKRVEQLEAKVRHLEQEVEQLKKPIPVAVTLEKTTEQKPET